MQARKLTLRNKLLGLALSSSLVVTLIALGVLHNAQAQAKLIYISMSMSLTGAEAENGELTKSAALMAIEEAAAKGGVAGYKIETIILDDANPTIGQGDPALGAANARKLAENNDVVANIGPLSSGILKAMAPILSEADLATLTPATNPDLTDPKFAAQYRPKGKLIIFRSETTDAYQGPNMANFFAEKLKVKSIYLLDDGTAFGVGIANAFQGQAEKKGIKVLGHDQLNPAEADYHVILTKINGLKPDGLYFGGSRLVGVKLMKQAYDTIPGMIKGAGDGLYGGAVLKGAGFPAADGWYVTIAGPHLLENPELQPWVARFVKRWGKQPSDSSLMGYDDALVILDAIQRVAKSGKPVNRHTVRDAIQTTHLKTLQGVISYDANGDLESKVVSVFKIEHNSKYSDDDVLHQFKYMGVAPSQ